MDLELTVKHLDTDDPAALFCRHPGQTKQQDCFIALDCEDGELWADYSVEDGARPANVFNRRTLRWSIPTLTAKAANALLDEIAPLARRILAGADIEWDGHNLTGVFTNDALDAEEGIAALIASGYDDESQIVVGYDADDYFGAVPSAQTCDEYGITADTTDAEIKQKATAADAEAAAGLDHHYGHMFLTGTVEYFTSLRDDLREQRDEDA